MPDAKDVVLKHIAAFNDRESDADPWAADAELVAPGGQASGRDDVIGFLGVFEEAFPDLRLEITQLLADGPAGAAEGTIAGTHDGVLHTPTAMSRRRDEPLSFGGRRSMSPTPTR
jgi:predicted ester cyclase